ncbi:MAG TPA: PrsW family glutamic-type intramembrane protease [Tepidisphaeraceae bacterium]|nr:PrsW family glutamic-type intramembrane protease [Tepidisphaeraceae bacterium]
MPVYTLTFLCAAAMALWIYHYDRHEKEPWHAVILAVLIGFAAMWVIGVIDDLALQLTQLRRHQVLPRAALIALIEEGGKLITIYLLARLILRRQFNDPMDGLIYGRLMGLGMAVEESLLYLGLSQPSLQTLGVEVVRLFAHSLMGALVGFAVGIGASPDGRHQRYPLLATACLGLSITLHFAWNAAAYGSSQEPMYRLMPMAVMLTMSAAWRWLWNIAEQRSRRIFAPATA